jgi:uncharacterized membrane protein YhaH (DUF805 family)
MSWSDFLLSSRGRISLKAFWLQWNIPVSIIVFVLNFVVLPADRPALRVILNVLCFWPSLVIVARRCHDRNRVLTFMLVVMIPVIGWIWLFVELYLLPGTVGPNRFGPDPRVRAEDAATAAAVVE